MCPGKEQSAPANSCRAILDCDSSSSSGHYWIGSSNGAAILRYCDMKHTCGHITGGWMNIAMLDMREEDAECPSGLRSRPQDGQNLCGIDIDGSGCSQLFFSSSSLTYNHVCGKIVAYQYGSPGSFETSRNSIDDLYVEGISLTYSSSSRQHIWTFAGATDEVGSHPESNCPCINVNQVDRPGSPPAFIGNDYFCDTGSESTFRDNFFYGEDPLWDGAGCGPTNTCCSLNNPPWFLKQLESTTTSDIEMRVCANHNRFDKDILIEQVELYVQ